MSDRRESTPAAPPKTAREERAERLAAELRANLRRRKDQVRGRDAAETPQSDTGPCEDAGADHSK